jgi:hypothetical protein
LSIHRNLDGSQQGDTQSCHSSSFERNRRHATFIIVHDFCQITTELPRWRHDSTTLIFYTDAVNNIQNSTKEVEMSTKSFLTLLLVAAFVVVIAFTAQAAFATTTPVKELDSATRSYSAWAKSVEANNSYLDSATRSYVAWAKAVEANRIAMDSATRSYTAWAKAVESNSAANYFIPSNGNTELDSATRSYIAWAKAAVCGSPYDNDITLDSATRSYIGWARSLQCKP